MRLKWDCDKKPEALARGDWFMTEHGVVEFDELIRSTPGVYAVIYYRESEIGDDRVKGVVMVAPNDMLAVYRPNESSHTTSQVLAALRRIVARYETVVVGDDRQAGSETEGAKNRARDLDVAKTWLKMQRSTTFTNWVRQEL